MGCYKIGKSICFDSLDECIAQNQLSLPPKNMSKTRLDKVVAHATSQHGWLLLEGRLSLAGKCFLRCGNGHVWAAFPNNLTRNDKKSWCPHRDCSSLRILQSRDSIDMNLEVEHLCKMKGFIWLSGVYINQREKSLLCECVKCKSHDFLSRNQLRSVNFKCKTCSEEEAYAATVELLEGAGIELVTPSPLPKKKSRVKCRCLRCKRPWSPILDAVMRSSKQSSLYGCGKCVGWYETDKDFAEEAKPFVDSRRGKILDVHWENKGEHRQRVVLISCQEVGHAEFTRTISQLKKGVWCRDCSSPGQKELLTRGVLEHLLGAKFKKVSPKSGLKLIGEKLELDGYCAKYEIAFEHQGAQHYEYIPHFHRNQEGFKARLEADARKRKACERAGITLIEVSDKLKVNEFESEIRGILSNKRPELQLNVEPFELGYIKYGRSQERADYLVNAQKAAAKRNGKCLSTKYVSSSDNLIFKCSNANHSSWGASYSSVVKQGTWCPKCGDENVGIKNRVDSLKLESLCVDANVSLLKGQKKHKEVVKYLVEYIDCKHEDYLSLTQIKSKRKCMECPNPARGGSQRLTIDVFEDYAKKRNGILLSKYYINNAQKLLFSCDKGHAWPVSGANIRKAESWCPECAGRKIPDLDIEEFLRKEKESYFLKFKSN